MLSSAVFQIQTGIQIFVLPEKEIAAYFFNDLERLNGEETNDFARKKILFYPTSHKRPYEIEKVDSTNLLLRTEVLNRLSDGSRKLAVVTYPEALCEKVITKQYLSKNKLKLQIGEKVSLDFIIELLSEYEFERVDFVVEPGQFSVRGGLVDVFPFS